jgi:hypothetical protein
MAASFLQVFRCRFTSFLNADEATASEQPPPVL